MFRFVWLFYISIVLNAYSLEMDDVILYRFDILYNSTCILGLFDDFDSEAYPTYFDSDFRPVRYEYSLWGIDSVAGYLKSGYNLEFCFE